MADDFVGLWLPAGDQESTQLPSYCSVVWRAPRWNHRGLQQEPRWIRLANCVGVRIITEEAQVHLLPEARPRTSRRVLQRSLPELRQPSKSKGSGDGTGPWIRQDVWAERRKAFWWPEATNCHSSCANQEPQDHDFGRSNQCSWRAELGDCTASLRSLYGRSYVSCDCPQNEHN